jgi:hypothetical protein
MNSALDFYGLEIKQLQSPFNGALYLTLVNRLGDDIAQLATLMSTSEIQFFKKLVYFKALSCTKCQLNKVG